ncbi:hypothetical protein ACWC10_12420 [Streptomyces sp. NPDC001595]|uniref:hypothetical protein n=1 Tax=Streptomyces sp. NPDC001532 TaxID=3154520 RepID=UPI00332C6B8A
MTPWLRALSAAGLGAVLVLPGGGASYGAVPSYGSSSYGSPPYGSSPYASFPYGVAATRGPVAPGEAVATSGPAPAYVPGSTFRPVSPYTPGSTFRPMSTYAPAPGYAVVATPVGRSPSAKSPSPSLSRAGNPAGEGRKRPGRREEPVEPSRPPVPPPVEPEAEETPAYEATAVPPEAAVVDGERAGEPVLRILPLGSGMVLIGLGLGLAFVGLRVRRDQV